MARQFNEHHLPHIGLDLCLCVRLVAATAMHNECETANIFSKNKIACEYVALCLIIADHFALVEGRK